MERMAGGRAGKSPRKQPRPGFDGDKPKPLTSLTNVEIQELFHPVLFDEVGGKFGTGDILLFYGTESSKSKLIRNFQVENCWFNHAAVVIRDPPDEVLAAYPKVRRVPNHTYIFEVAEQRHGMVGLRMFLDEYAKRTHPTTYIFWRQLCMGPEASWRARDYPGLCKMLIDAKDIPYEKGYVNFVLAKLHMNGEDLSSLFCSEAVMWALKAMGVVRADVNCSQYFPRHLSEHLKPGKLARVMPRGHYEVERLLLGPYMPPMPPMPPAPS
eukprot:RCo001930